MSSSFLSRFQDRIVTQNGDGSIQNADIANRANRSQRAAPSGNSQLHKQNSRNQTLNQTEASPLPKPPPPPPRPNQNRLVEDQAPTPAKFEFQLNGGQFSRDSPKSYSVPSTGRSTGSDAVEPPTGRTSSFPTTPQSHNSRASQAGAAVVAKPRLSDLRRAMESVPDVPPVAINSAAKAREKKEDNQHQPRTEEVTPPMSPLDMYIKKYQQAGNKREAFGIAAKKQSGSSSQNGGNYEDDSDDQEGDSLDQHMQGSPRKISRGSDEGYLNAWQANQQTHHNGPSKNIRQRRQQQPKKPPSQESPEPARPNPEEVNEKYIRSDKDKLYYSKKARAVDYTPKSLKEYKQKKPQEYIELGKLQPDLNSEELQVKRANAERIKQFSKNLQIVNAQNISVQPKKKQSIEKELSKREKALLFAKNVPKPKLVTKACESEEQDPANLADATEIEGYGDDVMMRGLNGLVLDGERQSSLKLLELEMKHDNARADIEAIKRELRL